MKLYTNDNHTHDVKWVELWSENERFFLAETKSGDVIKIELENLNKIKE